MFDVGWPELLVILAVALLVFGPQRMLELARTAGKALREFRQITGEFSRTFTDVLKEEAPGRPATAPDAGQPLLPIIADSLPIPPPAPVPPDEHDSADLTMPPFPAGSEPHGEPGPASPPNASDPED